MDRMAVHTQHHQDRENHTDSASSHGLGTLLLDLSLYPSQMHGLVNCGMRKMMQTPRDRFVHACAAGGTNVPVLPLKMPRSIKMTRRLGKGCGAVL